MLIGNKKDIEEWLNNLWNSGFVFLRFNTYKTEELDMGWKEELRKHGRMYEKDNKHVTFHHIRLLFLELRHNKMKHPLVGTIENNQIQVNPGGSRLMVAKKLRIPTVPLDLICKEEKIPTFINPLAKSKKYQVIKHERQFLKPFKDTNEKVEIEFTSGKKFCYEIHFENAFHWCVDDVDTWIDSKQHIQCPNPIDYYFI